MAVIETKYSIGDVVFYAGTTTTTLKHPCPDCNDERKWKAISPAGNEYDFACPRCSTRYSKHDELNLNYTAHVPAVHRLTIGSVQFNSSSGSWDSGARYMCAETGVGSGSVYEEAKLFPSEGEAIRCAEGIAAVANSTQPHITKRYDRALEVSDYQLENGLLKKAADAKSEAGRLLWNLDDLFSTIADASDKDAILEAVDDYKTFWQQSDKERAASVGTDPEGGDNSLAPFIGDAVGVSRDAQNTPQVSDNEL